MRDAKKADLEKLFGAEPGLDGELARLVESQPNAKVLIYYSGHGATDAAQTETYLLPVDVESYREEIGGYKLSTLYANLARLNAKSVLVLLETDYGGDHGAYGAAAQPAGDAKITALPRAPLPSLTVLAASDRGQRTLIDVTYDIGLFTRYLIEGLAGDADLAADRQWRRRGRQRRDLCLHRSLRRPRGAQDVRHAPASGLFQRRHQRAGHARRARSAAVSSARASPSLPTLLRA